MKVISYYFKDIDFISRNFSFELDDSSIYKTYQGAIFSLITFITAFILAFMFGKEVYQRKIPSTNNSIEAIDYSVIYLSNFPIMFALYDNNGEAFDNMFDFIDVEVEYVTQIKNEGIKLYKNYSLVPVTMNTHFNEFDDVAQDLFADYKIRGFINVLNFTETDHITNEMGTFGSSFIRLQFKICDKTNDTRSCKADDEFLNSIPYINIRHIDFNVDSLSYDNPVKPYIKSSYYSLAKNAQKLVYSSFINAYFESDNGWIFEDKNVTHFYYKTETNFDINIYPKEANVRNCLTAVFSSEKSRYKVIRNYMKVQELFAKVGGIANAILLIIKVLTYHYLRFIYLSFIRRNSFVQMSAEIKKSYNTISKNDSKYENINLSNNYCSKFINKAIPYIEERDINNSENFNYHIKPINNIEKESNKFNINYININSQSIIKRENMKEEKQVSRMNNRYETPKRNTVSYNIGNSNAALVYNNNKINILNAINNIDEKNRNIEGVSNLQNFNIKNNNNDDIKLKLKNDNIDNNGNVKINDIFKHKYLSSNLRIQSLIQKNNFTEIEDHDLSYFKYILSYLCCCYDKKIKKIYNKEFRKVKDLLDIRLFKQFLIKSYYEKFKILV